MQMRAPISRITDRKQSRLGSAIVLAAVIFAGVDAGAQDVNRLNQPADALIESICTDIMLVQRGTVQFIACSESLMRSHGIQSRGSSIQSAIAECKKGSLREGTGEFATCVLDQRNHIEDTQLPSGEIESVVVSAVKLRFPAALSRTSFVSSTPKERRRKQEYACAQLGLLPGFGAFSQCVADLAVSLYSADGTPG